MPRKTKELEEIPVESTKKSTKKVTSTAKNPTNTVKKATTKKTVEKKSINTKQSTTKVASKSTAKSTKITDTKATTSATKTATKSTKNTTTTADSKSAKNTNTKAVAKKDGLSKSTNTKPSGTTSKNVEYYDLPLRYNQTIVKILAQTPNMLFVYWDIADTDRKLFEEHYGDDFFSGTKPVLIIHNETMNYSFEIEINDFANSWYLHVNDANCKYEIELGRRPFAHTSTIKEEYIYISSSNEMNSPNNHILFEKFNPSVTYKNLKNGNTTKRDFSSLSNYKNMQEIYNIYDLYKTIYKDNLFGEITGTDLTNPSSMSSSSFK